MSKLRLEVVSDANEGRHWEFDRHDTFLVGRASQSHLRITGDPAVSRHHFMLEVNPPNCYVRDLGSRNGTRVNGRPIKESSLLDGDVVTVGQTTLRLTSGTGGLAVTESARPIFNGMEEDESKDRSSVAADHASGRSGDARSSSSDTHDIPAIPGFGIDRKLGEGGMGVVYAATHQATGTAVALKILQPEFIATEGSLRRFLREVSVLRDLEHPRIVRFVDSGVFNNQLYFAMELIDTVRHDEIFASTPVPDRIRLACGIICQVLDALDFAHRRSYVHRDIKPENILLTRTAKKLRTKVADFGLAKNYEDAGLSGITRGGQICGTRPYMCPEQVINCRDAKPHCDIYSVGATLYRLLTGTFALDFSGSKDPFLVILEDDPIPLRARVDSIPAELESVVMRSMLKNPKARFTTAKEMRRALLPFAKRASDRQPNTDEV